MIPTLSKVQKEAHERMLATLPVRTHVQVREFKYTGNKMPSHEASKAGKKGRAAAGLVVPEFRTLKMKMNDKRRKFNGKLK